MRAALLGGVIAALCGGLLFACSSSDSGSDSSGSTGPTGAGGTDSGAGGSGTGGTTSAGGTGTGGTGGTSSAGGTGTGGTSSAGGTGTGGTSSAGGNGTGGNATGGGSSITKGGSVSVSNTVLKVAGMPFATYSGSASFYDSVASSGAKCTITKSGMCNVISCDLSGAGGAGGSPATVPNAGDIHIDGGADALELHVDATGVYKSVSGMKSLFQGGETLMFTGAGATVPAFSGMLTAPQSPVVSEPTLPMAGTALAIDRSMDFNVKWSGATQGQIDVGLTSIAGMMSATIGCAFDASTGSATIPAADLAVLPVGTGSFSIGGLANTIVMAGDYAVQLIAATTGADANGNIAAGQAKVN